MTEDEKPEPRPCQAWWDWYLSPPEDWRKKYGDAFVWTTEEKMLMQQQERTHEEVAVPTIRSSKRK